MRLWKEKIVIKAPIEHVFKCVTDFDFFEDFILSQKNEFIEDLKESGINKLKFQYDKSSDEITIISDYPLFKIVPEKKILNEYISGKLVPLKEPIKRLGVAQIECILTKINGDTELLTEVSSIEEPNIFWKIFIKIISKILRFQSKADMKKFVKFVEESA